MIQFNNRIDNGFNGKPCKLAETTPYAKKKIVEAEQWAAKERDKCLEKVEKISKDIKSLIKKKEDVEPKKKELERVSEELDSITPKFWKMVCDVMLDFDEGDQPLEFYQDDNFPESTFWGLYHFFLKPWSRTNS